MNTQQPLNDEEFERLGNFLNEIGDSAMNIEQVDGFFAALICSPDVVQPSKYLPHVFGEEYRFDSGEQFADIFTLLMRHWNTIASALAVTLEKDEVYLPVMLEDENGVAQGNDWVYGFMDGARLCPKGWAELFEMDEGYGPMLPFLILEHEYDEDPKTRSPEITPESRTELIQSMMVQLTWIYRHFAKQRIAAVKTPIRRRGPKVGRNEPCPCGSGRKFKHCCAVNSPVFH
jgi:uncharacterized protein